MKFVFAEFHIFEYYTPMNRILLLFLPSSTFCFRSRKTDSLLAELKNHNSADTTRLNILPISLTIIVMKIGIRFAFCTWSIGSRPWVGWKIKMATWWRDYVTKSGARFQCDSFLPKRNNTFAKQLVKINSRLISYNNLGNALFNLSRYQESIAAFEEGAKIIKASEEADAVRLYTIRNNESTVYLTLADYPTALKCLFDAATAAERMKDSSTLMDIYINISIAYRNIPDYPTSLKYAEKSMVCCQHGQNKKTGKCLHDYYGEIHWMKWKTKWSCGVLSQIQRTFNNHWR